MRRSLSLARVRHEVTITDRNGRRRTFTRLEKDDRFHEVVDGKPKAEPMTAAELREIGSAERRFLTRN